MSHHQNAVSIASCDSYRPEVVSKSLDQLFAGLGMDPKDPFADMIRPGMRVFIKPNWVASRWRRSCAHQDDLYSVITHPAVIEAVADRAALALRGQGELIIADNPSIDADFEELMQKTGIRRLEDKYDVPCHIYDLRPLRCPSLDVYGKKSEMVRQPGDPNGEYAIDLGQDSLLNGVDSTLFRGVFDEREETVAAHTGNHHMYTYSNSLYSSDVYISIPKLKTHQKVGVTLNLKGLVGSITQKNQLVHWRVGSPETGGDEYPDEKSLRASQHARVTHRGAWPGNDTIWRMVADLYQGLLRKSDRIYFSIIDGILAGDGQGPFCPNAKYAATLIGGSNLLYTDIAATRYMGIDPNKIRYLSYFIDRDQLCPNKDISVIVNNRIVNDFFSAPTLYKDFRVVEQWSDIKSLSQNKGQRGTIE